MAESRRKLIIEIGFHLVNTLLMLTSIAAIWISIKVEFGVDKSENFSDDEKYWIKKVGTSGIISGAFGFWDAALGVMSVINRKAFFGGHGIFGFATFIAGIFTIHYAGRLVPSGNVHESYQLMALGLGLVCLEIPCTALEWALLAEEKRQVVLIIRSNSKSDVEKENSEADEEKSSQSDKEDDDKVKIKLRTQEKEA